jgi:hypothetical protein
LQGPVDVVELIGGNHRRIGCALRVSCALALATEAGIAGTLLPEASATSFSADFLLSVELDATLLDLRCV